MAWTNKWINEHISKLNAMISNIYSSGIKVPLIFPQRYMTIKKTQKIYMQPYLQIKNPNSQKIPLNCYTFLNGLLASLDSGFFWIEWNNTWIIRTSQQSWWKLVLLACA